MKKLTTILAAGLAVLAYHTASAQVGVHVSFNLGGSPVQYSDGYNDDYYYLPEAEAYYSVPQHCYFYNDGAQWVSAAYLPGRFHDMDWRSARRFEIRGYRPFMHHDVYRTRYGGYDQRVGYYGDRGGFDRPRDYEDRRFDRSFGGGNFDNRDRRYNGGQFENRGGWNRPQDNQDNREGQYQNERNRGGWNRQQPGNDGGYNQNRGGFDQPQNNRGGQYQNDQNRGGWNQNRGGRDQQPANNDGRNGQGGMRQGNGDNHFAANEMGVIRPPRL